MNVEILLLSLPHALKSPPLQLICFHGDTSRPASQLRLEVSARFTWKTSRKALHMLSPMCRAEVSDTAGWQGKGTKKIASGKLVNIQQNMEHQPFFMEKHTLFCWPCSSAKCETFPEGRPSHVSSGGHPPSCHGSHIHSK